MSGWMDTEAHGDGLRITRLSTIESVIEIPEQVDGKAVESIGPSFLAGCPGKGSRRLIIPASVTDFDSGMLDGVSGISEIDYGGELETFSAAKIVASSNCTLRCKCRGRDFEFQFLSGNPMSFPEFDTVLLSFFMRLTPEIAIKRLSFPIGLTDDCRDQYKAYLSKTVMPRAEQAVSTGDAASLRMLFESGVLTTDDLKKLLVRSVDSGKIPITSMLMSEIRRRASDESETLRNSTH